MAFRGKHLFFDFAISSIGVWQCVSLHIKNKPKQNTVGVRENMKDVLYSTGERAQMRLGPRQVTCLYKLGFIKMVKESLAQPP